MKRTNYTVLKIVAVLTMIAGDMGYLLIHYLSDTWIMIMAAVGNLSFPLFAFMLTESFLRCRNKNRYKYKLITLILLAILSEIPFNIFVSGMWKYPFKNNVCFTLFLGFLMLILLDKDWLQICRYFKKHKKLKKIYSFLIKTVITSTFMLVNYLLCNDYSYTGILLIALFYLFRNHKLLRAVLPLLILIISEANILYIPVIIDMILIAIYDSKDVNMPKPFKYGLRCIYPVMLSIMAVISKII